MAVNVNTCNGSAGSPGQKENNKYIRVFIIPANKCNHKNVLIVINVIVIFAQHYLHAMTRLSVNINKIATLRNSRGGDNPNLVQVAKDCERFGAQGITVHPRPDERHIRYDDVFALKKIVTTEFNIEGNCQEQKFIDLVLANKPEQVTLVPDVLGQITSNHGWDTITNQQYLKDTIKVFKNAGIRVSIFVDPVVDMVEAAATTGTDRIELYTEAYAHNYAANKETAIAPYVKAAEVAQKLGLGINAGHDLDLHNLQYFAQNIPALDEVSIGHALISDALYYGLENTIQMYLRQLA
jgi:pyridoxine 5-phosphate synthase